MKPGKMEPYEKAKDRCIEMDGQLAEVHTEDELETAMEALKPYVSFKGYDVVWTGAVKNTTKGAKEHSYYWSSSLTEVNFDILKLNNESSPCTESECTLILHSDGKVWPMSRKGLSEATALCKLRTINTTNTGYQFEEQLKKEVQVRKESINALDVQMKKYNESSESNVTSLKKSKSVLFVLCSLNLIALLALGVFIFIIWRKVN